MILGQQLIHSLIEPIANKLLAKDASAQIKLVKLEDKSFAVKLTNLSIQVKLSVIQQTLRFSTNLDGADCTIITTSDQLKQLSDASLLTKLIREDKLSLEGDLAIAQAFSSLLMENNIDWQQALSQYVGDGMAYRILSTAKGIQTFAQQKSTDLTYTTSSLLTDEINVAVTEQQVAEFSNQVDQLSASTERLAAEIQQLRGS